MGIPTSVGLAGFVDAPPEVSTKENGLAEARVRVRATRWVEQPDGSQELEAVRCVLVAYGDLAHRIDARFWAGDAIVAGGRVRKTGDGVEEFVANRVGHDVARTTYTVRRTGAEPRR